MHTATRAVQVTILTLSLAASTIARADLLLGASFGYTHLRYLDSAAEDYSNNIVGIPGSASWTQPGLRIGYASPGGRWDLNADIGLVRRSGPIFSDQTTIEVLPQLQVSARGPDLPGLFMNVGVGFVHEAVPSLASTTVTATRPVLGAGVGARMPVADGHGFLRAELRYEHISESEKRLSPFSTFTFPSTNLFSLKLGFDLLVMS